MSGNVQSIEVSNFKGVEHLRLEPEGSSLVLLTGRNGAGKSSFLDALVEIIDPQGVKLTPKPIRDGATEAVAEIVTEDIVLTRTWKKDDAGTLVARATDGAKYSSGRDVVAKLTGGALFEPFAFVSLPEKAQREELLRRVDLDIDLDEVAAKRAVLFEGRTEVNREVKRLQGALASLPTPLPNAPREGVSLADALKELKAAEKLDDAINRSETTRVSAERDIVELEENLRVARARLVELNEYLAKAVRPDLVAAREKVDQIEQINDEARAAREWDNLNVRVSEAVAHSESLTEAVAELDRAKAEALAKAKFPVAGLSVDESGILFDGVPFKQVNTAKQVEVAFALSTSGDRELRLVIIREGSLLDDETLAGIQRIAEERDYLVLVEKVASGEVGFEYVGGEK